MPRYHCLSKMKVERDDVVFGSRDWIVN